MSFASVDTGSTGSGLQGPWVSFHLRDGKHRAGTFSIRRKKDKDSPAEVAEFTGFLTAIMIDGDTLKTGWIKRQMGEFPERHWNASVARFEDAPTNEKNQFGKSVWAQNFAIRGCWKNERGEMEAFTWEASGVIEYNAFSALLNKHIAPQARANDGKCAVIKLATIEWIDTAGGKLPAPVFELVKWAERPAALVESTGYDADLPDANPDEGYRPDPRSNGYQPNTPSKAAREAAYAAQAPAGGGAGGGAGSGSGDFLNDEIPFAPSVL
jgi:hypothetical protein